MNTPLHVLFDICLFVCTGAFSSPEVCQLYVCLMVTDAAHGVLPHCKYCSAMHRPMAAVPCIDQWRFAVCPVHYFPVKTAPMFFLLFINLVS